MKIKQTVLLLGLATFGLVSFAQDNKPDPTPADSPPPASPEPVKAEVAAPVPTPVLAQAVPAVPVAAPTPAAPAPTPVVAAAPANPTDPVPLIELYDVPLTDAIRNLARQSNLNFQFDPRVTPLDAMGKPTNQPNVSIRFENVSAQEALQAVLDNYNLVLIQDPKSKIARVTIKDPKMDEALFSRTFQLRYSDPTNMTLLVKATLSPRSSVMADTRTGQLIVSTTEKEMDGVQGLITQLDSPTKQVLIEARIFETAHNPSSVHGIDWSGTLANQNFEFGNNTPDFSAGKPGTPAIPAVQAPDGTLLTPGVPAVPATPTVFGRTFSGTPRLTMNTASGFYPGLGFLNADGVKGALSFLNNDADTEVISTPRAVTLDNQTAKLEVTKAFPIFLITPGSANSPACASITYTNLGTILSVTPRITADRNISLRVVPEVSNIDSKDTETLNGTVNTANIYAIRRIDTKVMIPSGNTLVMGGLISDTKSKTFIKVPLLGDLPGIGLLFRHEAKNRNKGNLLIFVTPTIVDDEAYHVTTSGAEFLNNRIVEKPEAEESAWESGIPHDWSKPVY